MIFQQFVIDPLILLILLVLRHYKLIEFKIFEVADL
jgi:hypothetical protein